MPTCVPAPQRDAVGFANNPAGQDTCIETNQKTFTAQMKCESSNGRTEPVAWIFSDQCGLRQLLLQEFGFKTIHFYHDLHSRNQCQILLTEHALQKPALVWIRFAGPCAGSGNKHDALRSEHLVRIVHQQKTSNGVVVIEASERSQAWNLQAVREILEELHTSQHRWCNYETLDSADAEPCCSCIRLLTNFDMSDGSRCNCPKGLQHVHQKELKRNAAHRYATVMRNLMHLVLSSAHSQCADLPKQMPAKGQPEFNRLDMNITEDGERKAVRFSSLLTSKTVNKEIAFNPTPPNNADSSSGPNDFWIRNGKKQVIRVHAQPRTSLYRPDSSSCPVPVEMLRPSRQSKIRAVPEFHMIDQQPLIIDDTWNDSNQTEVGFAWTGTTAFEVADAKMMFPTEEAIKQKARKASGHVVKPRFKHVEQHQDDCGEDLSSITMKDAEPNDQVDEQSQQQRVHDAVCSMFSHKRHHLFGSGFFASKAAILAAVTMSMYVTSMSCVDKIEAMPTTSTNIHSMEYVFNTRSKISHDGLDCMELFGGSGTTTFVLAKHYGLRTGVNFELLCGVDLTKRDDVEYLFKYVRRNKPLVILMAPPCKGYSKWGSLNQKINPEAWKASRDLSVPLAKLCGNIAAEQLNNQRDFLIEQPQGSGLYKESEWLKILHRLYTVIFDQCMTGLQMNSPPFWPIKKPTECKASHPALLVHLQNLRCDGSHKHAHIGHWGQGDVPTAKSSETQVWPLELCERIAGGVVECITHKTENGCYFFPAEAAPEPAAEGAQPARITCPGCRGHLRKTDPKHTRDAGCKFPNVVPISWTCPGCVANRHRAHESHTNGPECQWSLARTMPEGASRERGTTHPRDGRVPASADPTGGLRLDRQSGVAGDGEPPIESFEPERLSPEEAERRRADKSESARPRRTRSEAGIQANQPPPLAIEDAPAPDDGASSEVVPVWTKHDLGFALQQLRSIREGIVRRTLRKLHIRWFHASLKRMHTLLQAAGVSPRVLSLIPSVIDTCDVCRSWQRVGPKSVASARVPEAFNQEVQVDLLFYKDHVLLHCIDACIRWSSVIKIPNREHISILEGFATGWLKLFGPPAAVISDREGALTTDQVAEWFDKKGIHLNLRARGQHCGTVERHNDLIRRQLHLLEDQAASEGMAVSFEMILSEAVFAKNALFQLGNVSPYESLFGRTPPLLAVLHQESGEQISDRDASRIRQIAIGSMIQATAANKTAIAEATKTRRSGELLELQLGDLVEFYRKPVSKRFNRLAWSC